MNDSLIVSSGRLPTMLMALSAAVSAPASQAELIADDRTAADPPATRRFDFEVVLNPALQAGSRVRAWLPIPPDGEHQTVREVHRKLPGRARSTTESKYGNRMIYFEQTVSESGAPAASVTWRVTRREAGSSRPTRSSKNLLPDERRRFLTANAKVPVEGRPLDLIKSLPLPDTSLEKARILYERVGEHMTYDKSRPGYGRGDVLWACDSGFGNCTDFHSLFISLARSQGLPARFEIGFPLPARRGSGQVAGYHCWAFFHVDNLGWVPTDISEADKHPQLKDYYFGNLTENRITFTTGRDLVLSPPQSGPPLNYFVYPYVEVDGAPLPNEKLGMVFLYKDL